MRLVTRDFAHPSSASIPISSQRVAPVPRTLRSTIALSLILSCACAARSVPRPGTAPVDETRAPTQGSAKTPGISTKGASAQHASFLRQLDHMYDVRNLALAKEQVPPPGFLPFDMRASPFPGAAFTSVEGHVIGSTLAKASPGPDNAVPGCPGAVAADGTLCPETLLPGHPLTGPQTKQLLATPLPNDPITVTGCAHPNTHAWVFYDDTRTPVGQLLVNFVCNTWSRGRGRLPEAMMRALRELCSESDLEGCWLGLEPQEQSQWHEAWNEWNRTRFMPSYWPQSRYMDRVLRPTSSGIVASTQQRNLSPRDKRVLCQWSHQYAAWSLRVGDEWGYEDSSGTSMLTILRWEQCIAAFPACDLPLEVLLPCMQHAQRGDPWFRKPDGAACKRHADCMWGFRTSQSAGQ